MTLKVHAVPGTDAGYILSTIDQTSSFLDLPVIELSASIKGMPAVTPLEQALKSAKAAGWDVDFGPVLVNEVDNVYLTMLRRTHV